MNNKGQLDFIDSEVLQSTAFLLLAGGSILATLLGVAISKNMDMIVMPLWQIPIVIAVELIASYVFASRM